MAEPQRRPSRSSTARANGGGNALYSSSTGTEIRGRSRARVAAAAAATTRTASAKGRRRQRSGSAAAGATGSGDDGSADEPLLPPLRDELPAMALLTLLYGIQGIPLGLTMGSIPFLLRDAASLSAVGAFSTAAWPYAAKLAWSPIVDATTLSVPLPTRKLLALLGVPFAAVAAALRGGGLERGRLFGSSSSKGSKSSRGKNNSSSSSRSGGAAAAAASSARGGGRGETTGGGDDEEEGRRPLFFHLLADSPRKSWIVPVQLLTSALLLSRGPAAARAVARGDVPAATLFFSALVLLAATQDVAVDGWALTLLSRGRVGWASTCQTVGTNLGFFASSAALLALGDPGFCARWWVFGRGKRGEVVGGGAGGASAALAARARRALASLPLPSSIAPSPAAATAKKGPPARALWSLGGYLLFWGWAYLAVTLFVAVCVPEGKQRRTAEEGQERGAGGGEDGGEREGGDKAGPSSSSPSSPLSEIALAYRRLAAVARLPAVRRLCLLLLTCRLAVLPAEAAAALALSERGVPRQALAGLVLLQLPAEALAAFLAGRAAGGGGGGSAGSSKRGKRGGGGGGASGAWVRGYWLRLAAALATTALVVTTRPSASPSCSSPSSSSSSSTSSSSCLSPARFSALALAGLLTAFSATLQFTCMGAVFARVADPRFGGSDLTLLNSVANLGITVPRGLVLFAVDRFGLGKVSTAAVALGAAAGAGWYARELPRLEALPESAWRARAAGGGKKKEEERN